MPTSAEVSLTVREDGSREGLPVIRLSLRDPMGEVRQIDVNEELGMQLVGDLAVAVRQLHYGARQMPSAWHGGPE